MSSPLSIPLPDPIRGALWMMGSMASWACMAAVARYFSGEFHTFEIVFFRSVFGGIFLLPWLFKVGLVGLKTQRVGMHLVRGGIGLAVIYLLFGAVARAPLGEVAAIMSTRPMVASLAAIVILHEVAHGRRWAATTIGFIGALLIIRPGISDVSAGAGLAFLAVIGMASLTIVMKSLARTEAPDTIVAWQMMVFTPCALIPAIFVWQTPDFWQFVLLASTGLFGTMTQRCLTRAYAAADATVIMPFDFTRLVFSALLGLILFQEFPDIWVWVGGLIILTGVLWMARQEAKASD
jgi:drug/metabolite transporter (DMT)-like permease